VSTRYRIYAA